MIFDRYNTMETDESSKPEGCSVTHWWRNDSSCEGVIAWDPFPWRLKTPPNGPQAYTLKSHCGGTVEYPGCHFKEF